MAPNALNNFLVLRSSECNINSYTNRTQSIYDDCEHFTELFNDLGETNDFK